MDVTEEKKTVEIFHQNLMTLLGRNNAVSMRQLSNDINASDSYVQKILSDKTNPSFDKIDSLGRYYDLKSWELFYDFEGATDFTLTIIQQLNHMPKDLLPHVKKYIEFLLNTQDNLPGSEDKLSVNRKEE